MFEIMPGGAKLYNVVKVSQMIGCSSIDFYTIGVFIHHWVSAFYPAHMGWFNPCGPDTDIYYSETEYPGYRRSNGQNETRISHTQ